MMSTSTYGAEDSDKRSSSSDIFYSKYYECYMTPGAYKLLVKRDLAAAKFTCNDKLISKLQDMLHDLEWETRL